MSLKLVRGYSLFITTLFISSLSSLHVEYDPLEFDLSGVFSV